MTELASFGTGRNFAGDAWAVSAKRDERAMSSKIRPVRCKDEHMKPDTQTSEQKQYILLFRGKDWDEGVPPERLQALMDRFTDWAQGLIKSGKVRGGQALGRTGVTITGRGVADGPFAETKEAIGGYTILAVDTLEEAIAIAKTAPFLDFDGSIEVREMLTECPVFKRIRERYGLVPKPLDFAAAA
jgi:hypothetical protein